MLKKLWYLNPIKVYIILLLVVVYSFFIDEKTYESVFFMNKAINGKYLIIHIISMMSFCFGAIFAKRYTLGYVHMVNHSKTEVYINRLAKIYKILFALCVLAYIIWYINFLRINGIGILSNFFSVDTISSMMYVMRNNSGKLSGITTLTELGIPTVSLGVYLIYKHKDSTKYKYSLLLLFALALFRTVAFSERLALIELIVPAVVTRLAITDVKSFSRSIFVKNLPLIGIVSLFIIFGLFEYSRSWQRHYINYYDSYMIFVVQRILGYYVDAINTECLYIEYSDFSILPFRSIQWLWLFPGMQEMYQYMTSYDVQNSFNEILYAYGNPEFNNPGGLLTFYIDYGYFFVLFQFVFGYSVGKVYKLYIKENIFGIMIYSYLYMVLLELPRHFLLGLSKTLVVFFGYILIYFLYYQRYSSIHKRKGVTS